MDIGAFHASITRPEAAYVRLEREDAPLSIYARPYVDEEFVYLHAVFVQHRSEGQGEVTKTRWCKNSSWRSWNEGVQNPTQSIPPKILKLARKALDEAIEDGKGGAEGLPEEIKEGGPEGDGAGTTGELL